MRSAFTAAFFIFATLCRAQATRPAAERVHDLEGFGGAIVHFSPDGGRLLTAGGDVAAVWDVATAKTLAPPLEHGAAIDNAGWNAKGDRVFSAGGNEVRFWDPATGKLVSHIHRPEGVRVSCMSPDGELIVIGSGENAGMVVEARSGQQVHSFDGFGALFSASFSRDSTKLLISHYPKGNSDKRDLVVRVVDPRNGRRLLAPVTTGGVERDGPNAAFSPDGTSVVIARAKGVMLMDLKGRRMLLLVEYDGPGLDSGFTDEVHFTRDGSGIVWCMDERTLLYDAKTGKRIGKGTRPLTASHPNDLQCLNDGRLIAFAGLAHQAGVWDLVTGQRLQGFGEIETNQIAASATGDVLAVSYLNTNSPRRGHTEIWRLLSPVFPADGRAK